jgi:hypothetical protein
MSLVSTGIRSIMRAHPRRDDSPFYEEIPKLATFLDQAFDWPKGYKVGKVTLYDDDEVRRLEIHLIITVWGDADLNTDEMDAAVRALSRVLQPAGWKDGSLEDVEELRGTARFSVYDAMVNFFEA